MRATISTGPPEKWKPADTIRAGESSERQPATLSDNTLNSRLATSLVLRFPLQRRRHGRPE